MARSFGGSELQVFRRVTAAAAGPALAAGMVMSWARALGEFGATIMFAGNTIGQTMTLPLVVYGEFQAGNLEASIAAAGFLVVAAAAVLLGVRILGFGRIADPG
jgi:molybdate transport system permease protein